MKNDTTCSVLGLTDNGCYYIEDAQQFRSCQNLCDGKLVHSLDEEECDSWCPGVLSN